MTDPSTKPRRRWWMYLGLILAGAFLFSLGLLIYVNTEAFQSLVRRRLIAEIERVTGGRVEIGTIHTTPLRLQADVRGITVHGGESATEIPLAHVDRIVARLKLRSILGSELAFHEMVFEQPVVHVAFYADGTTNVPPRKPSAGRSETAVEQLFALSVDRFELRRGQVFWDDQVLPLDLTTRDISLDMNYSFLHRRYDGRLLLGLVDTKLDDCRPFAWMSSAEFSLTSNSAVIPSLKWNSGHSHFSASAQITDFRKPHAQGEYEAQLDLSEVAAVTRRHDLQAGVLELKGHGEWSLDQFASNGLLNLRDFAWQDEQISFARASVTTGFAVTDQLLKLSKLQSRIFGGSVTGDAELDQWLAPAQRLSTSARKVLETAVMSATSPTKKPGEKNAKQNASESAKPRPPAIQSAVVALRLHDLSAGEVADALNAPAHRYPHFHPTGSVSGTLETRWKGTPRDAEIRFGLDVTPPERRVPGQLRLTAHAQGVYYAANDSLDLPQFTLTTPTSHVQGSGRLSTISTVRFSIHTLSLADWLPFIEVFRGPEVFPVTLNGSATFNGTLSGTVSSPQIAGSFAANDFDVIMRATANGRPHPAHWDSFSAAVQLSFHSVVVHNATLLRGDTSAEFDATATLQNGHFTGDTPFTLRAQVHNADVSALQTFAGADYPVSGKTELLVQASGTISDPRAQGHIHLSDAVAYGEGLRQFDANFRIGEGQVAFDDMHLFHEAAVVNGSAAYTPASRAFLLNISCKNLDISELHQLQSNRFHSEGQADFVLQAAGTPDAPSINGSVRVRDFTVDQEYAGELDLKAVTQGKEMQVTGDSKFRYGSLGIKGNVYLGGDYPADFNFQMDQLDLNALWKSYFRGRLTGTSAAAGTVQVRGPLRHPGQWTLEATLPALALDVENIKVHNQGPIRVSIANQLLNIQELHFVGDATDFAAHGSVQIAGTNNLDLTADGHLDMKLLSTLDSDLGSSGQITMNMTVGGTVAEPLPRGRFQITNGALSYAGLPSGLSELSGSLLFTRDRIRIEALSARTGGGTLDLSGDAGYFNQQISFNLSATAKDVRLRYPPGVSSTADAELHWTGSRSASTVSGDIRINKMAVTPGFDFSAYLERSRQLSTVTATNSPLNNIKLDIHVVTAPELQMRTTIARLSGDADLRLRGSVGRPAVLGRVDILEGRATFHGIRFTLERGDITFANPVAIEPQLNLQASTHVRNYDLNITLVGTPSRGLNLNYRSEPPLPKSDIIALLALGRTNDESAQLQQQSGQSLFSDQASALILSQALNSTVSSRMERLFGASNIKIDPQGLNTETNPTARGPQVTIEQEFANNLALTYSTNVSQSSQQIIQGEYYFSRNVSVVGTRDQNGVVSFDLRVRRRKK